MHFFFNYKPNNIGFYLFKCKVNVYNSVEESDYDNNIRKARYLIIDPDNPWFGWWGFPILSRLLYLIK